MFFLKFINIHSRQHRLKNIKLIKYTQIYKKNYKRNMFSLLSYWFLIFDILKPLSSYQELNFSKIITYNIYVYINVAQ